MGLICTDGHIGVSKDGIRGNVVIGSSIDANIVLDDIEIVTLCRPSVSHNDSEFGGSTFIISLPLPFARCIGNLEGMTIGMLIFVIFLNGQDSYLEECPRSIVREFLGGAFGGDGHAPHLVDGIHTSMYGPGISLSANIEFKQQLFEKMQELAKLIEYVGADGVSVFKPKIYGEEKNKVSCMLQVQNGTKFGDKIGFRYCIHKMLKMAAYQSYMRYLETVKSQNDRIIKRASELFDSERQLFTKKFLSKPEMNCILLVSKIH